MSATINDIVNEFETIAGAFDKFSSFAYANPYETKPVNNKSKPLLMVDKLRQHTISEQNNVRRYPFTLRIIEVFKDKNRKNTDYESKQEDLAKWAYQFTKEFLDRALAKTTEVDEPKGFYTLHDTNENIDAEFLERWGKEQYIGYEWTIPVYSFIDCSRGNFSY